MPLEIRRRSDGSLRPSWYGRFEVNGQRHCCNLGVAIEGKPPASGSLRERGDAAFERSRRRAQAALDETVLEARSNRSAASILERLYELKTSQPLRSVPLSDLADAWMRLPKRRKPGAQYVAQCQGILSRFSAFVQRRHSGITYMEQITPRHVVEFLQSETDRGVTARTWNESLRVLRSAFTHLMPTSAPNPCNRIPSRERETVHRQPFSPEELRAILAAAQDDDFVRPLLTTAACTAMRRADCCTLRWEDVDLASGFVTVKTAKTGATVQIPIFPLLREELLKHGPKQSGYVFPEQASMYRRNPDGITWRVQKVLAAAGLADTQAARRDGLRRASVRDFHSFRTTWVTLALTAGVPMELVRRVTGHTTADVVLKHYFQPDREQFRQALQTAMPALLTNGSQPSPQEQALAILDSMTAQSWRRDRERLCEILRRMTTVNGAYHDCQSQPLRFA